jgi:hypothetical protein
VWEIPDEEPGTLVELFAAEDSRGQNLVLYAVRDADAFRRSTEAINATVDPNELILAVQTCISLHLNPIGRLADQRRRLRCTAERARTAAAPQEFLTSLGEIERQAWLWRLTDLGLSYPDDPHIMADLRNMAAGLDDMCARGALLDRGGRSKYLAFGRLISDLARIFETATGRAAAITRNHYRSGGYSGRFWNLVEVIRPIAAAIIEVSGAGSLAFPANEPARGRYIESLLAAQKARAATR